MAQKSLDFDIKLLRFVPLGRIGLCRQPSTSFVAADGQIRIDRCSIHLPREDHMFRQTKWIVLCIVTSFLSTRAFCAADPATIAKQIDQDVEVLAAPSPEARLGAQVRLCRYGPEYSPDNLEACRVKNLYLGPNIMDRSRT
jgi:hypothetical protein